MILAKLLGFVIASYLACLLVPIRFRWMVLFASSLFFYALSGTVALVTMILASAFSFSCGILIEKSPVGSRIRRAVLFAGILIVVVWLCTVKFAAACSHRGFLFAVPLGISYASFSIMSYLADIYWERDRADRNFLKHLLYILFFPKIIQGPISRHGFISPSLFEGRPLSFKNFCFGCQRMMYGLFKKLVIAERLSRVTQVFFSDIGRFSGSRIAVAMVLAAIELYCDFSGYMDIVLGFTESIGMNMEENFRHPFFSCSVSEFWRRWHITLGAWFRDYVYTPLVMSRVVKRIGKWCRKRIGKEFCNKLMKSIAIAAVWLLTGLWHGTGANYILWGCMWGCLIILSTVLDGIYKKSLAFLHINAVAPLWKLFQMLRTALIFCFGILLTRIPNLSDARTAIAKLLNVFDVQAFFAKFPGVSGLNTYDIIVAMPFIVLLLLISIVQEKQSVRVLVSNFAAPVRWGIYAVGISFIVFFGTDGSEYGAGGFAYAYF